MEMNKKTPADRLNYSGDLGPVVDRLCGAYGIGKPAGYYVIEMGYEDCNVAIEASGGKYVAKIFSKERTPVIILRYGTIMKKAIDAGVNHPFLEKTSDGGVVYMDSAANGISMVLMKFIEGKTFLDMGRCPDDSERRAIIKQAAKIDRIDHHPAYLSDSWAIPNIHRTFQKVRKFIQADDLKLVERVLAQYDAIPAGSLPCCFVHGDFTKANIIKGDDGKMYILDFSVSNWQPRIQEISVILANLLYDKNDSLSLRDKAELVSDEYSGFNPLTQEERKYVYPYALAGIAMEFMGAHQEKYINGNDSEETGYWLDLGRNGLKKELSDG